MPPLVVPSPVLLDQSFPRTRDELETVATSLGNLQSLLSESRLQLLLTPSLCDFVGSYEWSESESLRLLNEIHRLIAQLTLAQGGMAILLETSEVHEYKPHPAPTYCTSEGLVEIWSDDVGRLKAVHDGVRGARTRPCVGIACDRAFAGEAKGNYPDGDGRPCFPLVGPDDLSLLDDAYEYDVPDDVNRWEISVREAKRNVIQLGATNVEPPHGGSHYKARFPGKRPWPIDPNTDPVPDRFIKELVDIVCIDKKVIKYVLKVGRWPQRRRLRMGSRVSLR